MGKDHLMRIFDKRKFASSATGIKVQWSLAENSEMRN